MFKYLKKKHSVSSLSLITLITSALVIIFLLGAMRFQQGETNVTGLIWSAILMSGLIVIVLVIILSRPASEGSSDSGNQPDDLGQSNLPTLRDLQNEKKYFAGILSHDLRSPLSSIILLSSYLKSKNEHPETNQYIDLIEQSSRKELEMMATLLSLMRADRSKPESLQELNLKTLAEKIIQSSESQITRKLLRTHLDISPEATVVADPDIFLLIFKSLISQAVYYSDPEQNIEIASSETNNRITIQLSIQSGQLPKMANEDLLTSDRLTSQNAVKGFPDCIDLYFSQQALNNYNGTIHVQTDGNGPECRFIMSLDRLSTPHIA